MRNKLIFLNLLLLGALFLIGRELLQKRQSAQLRAKNELQQKQKAAPAPPVSLPPVPAPLQAAGYLDVAQQTLFTKDRNPNIVVEAEKPKPLPPFPRFYGVMNLGDGAMAILSDGPGRQKTFKPGDKTGELTLAEIGTDTLVFEWEKQKLTKKFSDLQTKDAADAAPAGAADTARTTTTVATPPPTNVGKIGEPGTDIGGGLSACSSNDSSPAGTISNGKRKVVTDSPFGKVCRWEPVK